MKIALVNLPKFDCDTAPLALAILQSIAKKHDHDTEVYDLNVDLMHKVQEDQSLSGLWHLETKTGFSTVKKVVAFFDSYMDRLLTADMIAVSFFSFYSVAYGDLFLWRLRNKGFKGTVVVGGPGVSRFLQYTEKFLARRLIDYYVTGDGEVAFEKILTNDLPYLGVNNSNHIAINDLDNLPLPNFAGFNLEAYPRIANQLTLAIEGSRGCVRDCTFCDIKLLFQKYRYKSGARIFDEALNIVSNYGVTKIWFTDSLVNGNVKEFRNLLRLLAAYNKSVPSTKRIEWTSQYIIRPQKQYIEEDFQLLRDSGCYTLATGLESYSESVRRHLGKNFSNDDVRYFLNKCQEYDIRTFIMMIVGYPTETEKDFQDTLSFFDEFAHLADDNTITGVQLGQTMLVIPNTSIAENKDQLGITLDDNINVPLDKRWKNENSDTKTRVLRRLMAQKHAMEKGFQIRHDESQMMMFKRWFHDR